MKRLHLLAILALVEAGPATENYKDQYCTDPRTMKKHAAYTEWADAYSCTRHRCQPGGRNLAIYTVGCKRVEAPESAIECEEVVEDTNMQFPFCCTRLRCLVVVRGEVWTRVLGQPWETLPAAPWSHMYKMKKPPPGDTTFLPKSSNEGPIYELASEGETKKVLRSGKKAAKGDREGTDCNDVAPRAVSAPDIVIALSTAEDKEKKESNRDVDREGSDIEKRSRSSNRGHKPQLGTFSDDDSGREDHRNEVDVDDQLSDKEKVNELNSDEKYPTNSYGVTQKPKMRHSFSWTEIPQSSWDEHDVGLKDLEATVKDKFKVEKNEKTKKRVRSPDIAVLYRGLDPERQSQSDTMEIPSVPEFKEDKREEKPNNLQALVDAIGSRMRDIENVVQKMSEKVQQVKPFDSAEKRLQADPEVKPVPKHPNPFGSDKETRMKRPNPDGEHYKRFSVRNRSKYVHSADTTTEQPLFIEDTNLNGYFSDASNTVLRRANVQEPAATYMAPVENRRKSSQTITPEVSGETERKHKKHSHKKKKGKGKSHKKHHKEEKKKKAKVSSEIEHNVVSLEDSSAVTNM